MLIKESGGEFALLKKIVKPIGAADPAVIVGPGDDCAVLSAMASTDQYFLVTTDMIVEEDHFSLRWHSPFQVGKKLMECNVSDIVSKGGTPRYAVVSISIKKDTTVEFMEEVYRGLYESAAKHGVQVIGGDTTHGTEYVLNLTLLGVVDKKLLRLRSSAKVGDLICVTGMLGGSTAGLKLLQAGRVEGTAGKLLKKHLEPTSRTAKEGHSIAKYAHAMIDVSDGLASEVRHICEESKVGGVVEYEKIPLSEDTLEGARHLGLDAHDFALNGGEDFEIVFTISESKVAELGKEFSDFTVVGMILEQKDGIYMTKASKRMEIGKGYDHFG